MARFKRPRRGQDQPRHRFRSKPGDPRKQAASVMRRLQGSRIRSVGTVRSYQERLAQVAARLDTPLEKLTPAAAVAYLERRATEVGQKTLDMERQAIQAMMRHVTMQLPPGSTLRVVKAVRARTLEPRAYSPSQVRLVAARQAERNALATEIVHASGIRAHELLTLARPSEQPPHDRRAQSRLTGTAAEGMKFAGRDGVVYTVAGKGGLVREVLLPHRLAEPSAPPSRAPAGSCSARAAAPMDFATRSPSSACASWSGTPSTAWRSPSSPRRWVTCARTSPEPT